MEVRDQLYTPTTLSSGKEPQEQVGMRLSGSQHLTGHDSEETSLSLLKIEPRSSSPQQLVL